MSARSTAAWKHAIALALLFLSGFAALIYEIAWIRRAALVLGSTTAAVGTVVAVFFLGLALGGWLFGRAAARSERPLALFAALELCVGVFALAGPLAFELLDLAYGALWRALGESSAALAALRAALVAAVLLPPTVAMGGSLPLYCRQFVSERERIARRVALIYAWNTLGAAAGCAAAGFLLLPSIGLAWTMRAGGLTNLLCAALAASLRLRAPFKAEAVSLAAAPKARASGTVAFLFFAVGFVALGNEVLWTRYLGLLIRNTVHSYTLSLCAVLVGIALGSLLAAGPFDRVTRRARVFGACQVLAALIVLGASRLPPEAWRGVDSELAAAFALFLPAAVLSGASFPLAVRMVADDPALAGAATGRMAAVNTLGGVLGSLSVAQLALPLLGLERSFLILCGLGLATGAAAWLRLDESFAPRLRGAWVAAAALAFLGLAFLPDTRVPRDFLGGHGELLAFEEGLVSNLAVVREHGAKNLELDRWWQGSDARGHQTAAAHVPMLLHPSTRPGVRPGVRKVLVVGLGTGQTASRFLLHPIEQLDCVDLEPELFAFVREHFDSAWMDDPRVRLVHADGRGFIWHSEERYDVIALEVGQIFRPGVASFYTADFYARARERLAPGGLLVQFVPLAFFTPELLKGVVRTFLQAFPESVLWYNTGELLLIGAHAESFRAARDLFARLVDPAIAADLDFSLWGGISQRLRDSRVFAAGFLAGPPGLAALSEGGAIYVDDRPVLDHATADVDSAQANELALVALLRPHLDPFDPWLPLAPADRAAAAQLREGNLGAIAADALVRRADELGPAGDALLEEALRHNPDHVAAQKRLADRRFFAGRLDDARESFLRLCELVPDDGRARHGLGVTLFQLGRHTEALRELEAAGELLPDDAEIQNYLGVVLAKTGELERALARFERALKLRPDDAQARENLEAVRKALAATQ